MKTFVNWPVGTVLQTSPSPLQSHVRLEYCLLYFHSIEYYLLYFQSIEYYLLYLLVYGICLPLCTFFAFVLLFSDEEDEGHFTDSR